jgi:hypothetical protein
VVGLRHFIAGALYIEHGERDVDKAFNYLVASNPDHFRANRVRRCFDLSYLASY